MTRCGHLGKVRDIPGNEIQFLGSQNPLDRIFYSYAYIQIESKKEMFPTTEETSYLNHT